MSLQKWKKRFLYIILMYLAFYIFYVLEFGTRSVQILRIVHRNLQAERNLSIIPLSDKCELIVQPTWNDDLRASLNPNYDPFECPTGIGSYWKTCKTQNCTGVYQRWSEIDDRGRVRMINGSAWQKCSARSISYVDDQTYELGDWHDLDENVEFEEDVVYVECEKFDDVPAYRYLHSQIRPKLNTSEKVAPKEMPSVYIIVMDSFGSSHARRVFPKTLKYLKDNFEAVDMLFMNKVGSNSRPNGFAFLMGELVTDISRELYGGQSEKADLNYDQYCNKNVDGRGYILDKFTKKGYKTMIAEDWSAGVFNYPDCLGFKNNPVTHYMRPFQLYWEQVLKLKIDREPCIEVFHYINNYTEQFFKAYPDSPKAFLYWENHIGHNNPNVPFHADHYYLEFFERNREEFDKSFVFFMGDHGLRFGKFAQTPIGERDNNNPMLHISVPRNLRSNFALRQNLNANSQQLLSMFDLYETFTDIAENFEDGNIPDFTKPIQHDTKKRGSSLLRPLPSTARNCKTLPIPPEFCICEQPKIKINATSSFYHVAVLYSDTLNSRLLSTLSVRLCAWWGSGEVTEVLQFVGTTDVYEVTVRMEKGNAIFRGIVSGSGNDFILRSQYLTRLDRYGPAADCMLRNDLKDICHCK